MNHRKLSRFDNCLTISYHKSVTTIIEEQTISTRTLYRELPRIAKAAARGERFAVTKNGKPIFAIGPVRTIRGKSYDINEFKNIQWAGGDKDLSKNVDEVVYGT